MALRWARENAAADAAGAEAAAARARPFRLDYLHRLLRNLLNLSSRGRRRRVLQHSSGLRRSGLTQNERYPNE